MEEKKKKEFFDSLNRAGIAKVRAGITTGVYLGPWETLAQSWLDDAVNERFEADNREHRRTARSAPSSSYNALTAATATSTLEQWGDYRQE